MLLVELLSVLLISFVINLIPFASPSNILIASSAALLVADDPVGVGFLVALGATCAKLIHFGVSYFVGNHVSEKRRARLNVVGAKTKRWAPLAVFISAASPIPDDPVIIPLGLMRYSSVKFGASYFGGKLLVTVTGAFLAGYGEQLLSGYVSALALAAVSIVLTVVVTVVLMKVDLSKVVDRVLKKIGLRTEKARELTFFVEDQLGFCSIQPRDAADDSERVNPEQRE